mgnify:CR=1 FL=1
MSIPLEKAGQRSKFVLEKPQVDEEQLLSDLLSVVGKALDGYNAMRCTEGAALDADLRSRGNTILDLVSQVEQGNGQTVIDYRTRLENKLREVLANTSIDESRILTEAAIFADKAAIDEELVRLGSHFGVLREIIESNEALFSSASRIKAFLSLSIVAYFCKDLI